MLQVKVKNHNQRKYLLSARWNDQFAKLALTHTTGKSCAPVTSLVGGKDIVILRGSSISIKRKEKEREKLSRLWWRCNPVL